MKLYYSPGACSLGIHLLLEEIGTPYQTERVDLEEPPAHRPLTLVNPKSKVPTLVRDDGSVLTEYPAIAYWLASTHPHARLWPESIDDQARALELVDYLVATVHMRGFSRLFAPKKYAPTEADADKVRQQGRDMAVNGLTLVSERLDTRDYLLGAYSIADSALFYVERWAVAFEIELPANLAAHLARVQARPATAAVLAKEGLT